MDNGKTKWGAFIQDIQTKSEDELKEMINREVAIGGRESSIVRLHMRYSKLKTARERRELLNGETL